MKTTGIIALLLAAGLLGACASTAQRLTMPEYYAVEETPAKAPESMEITPKLVPYPGLDVSYVENGDGEVYFCANRFYCFFDNGWFHAETLSGPWTFVEMKYVPGDLYRVRGHLPPSLEQQRRVTALR